MGKKKEPSMRDLTVDPEEDDIQTVIRKREEKLERQRRIDKEYNKRYSMFSSKKTTAVWLLLSVVLFVVTVYALNVLFHAPNSTTGY